MTTIAQGQASSVEAILQSAVTAIVTIDHQGLMKKINPATERLFGYSSAELIGHNVKVLMPDPYRAEHDHYIDNYLTTGTKTIIGVGREVSGRRKDGTTFPIHLGVSAFEDGCRYFTGIIHDLSDRKQVENALRESERRLAQAQKMEAVGQLTGGIAHDFNNLLLIITGNLQLLEARLDREDLRALLKEAQDATELGSRLTDQLLTFARLRHLNPHVLRLNDIVTGVVSILRRTLGEHVSLTTSLAKDLWETKADPGQFQNVIVNLAVNARDAMPGGGKLVIETRNIALETQDVGPDADLKPGDYVQLSVLDTGTGMPPEVRDRAFHPFFTTKEKGRGTGLGLAMVYGFVKQSGGHVTIYSEVGQGTMVNLYLPRVATSSSAPWANTSMHKVDLQARETILVVEDDERVRRLTTTRLKEIGYQVLQASDGREALNILEKRIDIDLVFTDMIMPGGLSGLEVAKRARELKPAIKILLTSGYAGDLVNEEDFRREHLVMLCKPYGQVELVMALREVLSVPAGR